MIKLDRVVVVVAAFICILIIWMIYYARMNPELLKEDVNISATLKMNDTGRLEYRQCIIDIEVEKGEGQIDLIPYTPDDGIFTFAYEDEADGYYMPGNIGGGYWVTKTAINELVSNRIISEDAEIDLLGVWLPYEAGTYKIMLYIGDSNNKVDIEVVDLVAVYNEEKMGKDLSWAKITRLELDN